MKTEFSAEQLSDPDTRVSAGAIRKCVHCGFCTATCPTYVLLGDERDSPRGRIYLIREMLEKDQAPTADVVTHIDRCLSCLSCVTTCPSGVDYMHLIDHARSYVENRYRRPAAERILRWTLANTLPYQSRMRWAMRLGRLASPLQKVASRFRPLDAVAAMLKLARANSATKTVAIDSPAASARRGRVILQQGCAEPVLRPEFRAAAVRLLNRIGYDVEFATGEGCCGALPHHMGRKEQALEFTRRNVDAWTRAIGKQPVAAIVITASGCGTSIKDYGFLLREEPEYAERAARVSALARDISELVTPDDLHARTNVASIRVAYHAACSLHHGQKVLSPRVLLEAAGFQVGVPQEAHLCCGSAGTYNILQPRIADQLGQRKVDQLAALHPDVIATGNVGCAVQIGARTDTPVVHIVELLDWATGGPAPAAIAMSLARRS